MLLWPPRFCGPYTSEYSLHYFNLIFFQSNLPRINFTNSHSTNSYEKYLQVLQDLFIYIMNRAGKIRFSGAQKSVLLKASSGERCAPCNFVHLVALQGTCVRLIVYLVVHQMKYVMERWSNAMIFCNFLM